VERDCALVGIAEAHDGPHALGLAEPEPLCVLGSPAAVVSRLLAACALLIAQYLELFLRRVIVISVALCDQLFGDLTITGEPLHLKIRPVVIQSETSHSVADRLLGVQRGKL